MIPSMSSKEFLERAGLVETLRQPLSLMVDDNAVLSVPLPFPLPHAALTQHIEDGDPSPDRVETLVWPHGGPT